MAFTNPVDVLTMEDIMPNVVDTVLRANTFTTRIMTKDAQKFRAATQDFPIKYQKGTATQSFIGFDTLSTTFTDTRVLLKYNPRFNSANVALATSDVAANNTLRKVLDLTEVEMISRAQDLADSIGTQFYADGTGNSNKDFLGLGAIVSASGSIGGLSRSTYSTLQSTVTASSGTLSLSKMRTLFNNIADGAIVPNEAYTTYEVWALYEQLLQPQERIQKQVLAAPDFKGYTGFDALMFAGLPVAPDRKCTSGYLYFLNMNFLNFFTLDMLGGLDKSGYSGEKAKVGSKLFKGSQYSADENFGFFWTGFIHATNAMAWNSFVVVAGNLVSANPRRHGVLTGITGI